MVSETQHDALAKLRAHGGEGVIDKHGKIVASGVRLLGFDPITWLRLLTTGELEVRGPLRVGLTARGVEAAVAPPVKISPQHIRKNGDQKPRHPGAE